jgi:gamma-glutamyl phosphate reductase
VDQLCILKIKVNAQTSVMSQVNGAHRALVEENRAYTTIVELLDLLAKHNPVVKKNS